MGGILVAGKLIDGKAISAQIKAELVEEVRKLQQEYDITPGLAVVLVGEDPASKVYVGQKEKACTELGFVSQKHVLPVDVSEEKLLDLVRALNKDPEIDGILVQLPLPKHIDENKVIETIVPEKDVDGFHPVSVGKMVIGLPGFKPCTPHGVMVLLERSGVDLAGKEAVVVGRSNIVGKPVALMLLQKSATVTVCHSKTKDLGEVCRRADVLVVATGRPNTVTSDMVKDGVVVIDVGVNRLGTGKLVGDVDYDGVQPKASAITPVPGGVGPMTIAMLMLNTVESAKRRAGMPV
ncbi:MAG: bifunctional methylenetetrahydrofolate dehydrogenase/methenyltetrahydrofolate cyclohydrolase FolD [Rubrobacteridae bacterium]|nr:bifunctional methylenetetrahydrofolate dehydrogenase/methenyltetrahydrofolate cyclohydrolase FolD [Rubrobacteridae bacterium]